MHGYTRRVCVAGLIATLLALGGCLSESDDEGSASEVSGTGGNTPPSLSGNAPSAVTAGQTYTFKPAANDPDGDPLTFSADNLPGWASLDSGTGEITGTPGDADVGVYEGIVIRVSDGSATDSIGPFQVDVLAAGAATGSVTLSWTAPTQNKDGSPLTDLAGYRIYWGTTPGSYPNSVSIDNPGLTTYVVDGLVAGTYEFVATTYNTAGVESAFSNPATTVVN